MTIPLITLLMILSQALVPLFKRLILFFQMPYLLMQLFLLLCLAFAECALGEAVLQLAFLYRLSADLYLKGCGWKNGGAHDFGRGV